MSNFTEVKLLASTICAQGEYILPSTINYDTGAPGQHLEGLFDVPVNNRDTADLLDGVEIKYSSGQTPLTLLHLDPWPRPIRATAETARVPGANEQMLLDFGYFDDNGMWALRHLIRGTTPTTGHRVSGFFMVVDGKRANIHHVSRTEPVAYYDLEVVIAAICQKLRRLLLVEGLRDDHRVTYYRATLYQDPHALQIGSLIADGTLMIDLDCHVKDNGTVRNHGVKFRIYPSDLPKLYRRSEVICDHKTKSEIDQILRTNIT